MDRILLDDLKFDQSEEYIEQIYTEKFNEHFSELFEYYKYYLQDPVIFFGEHFALMHKYYERRKDHVYNELKKILTLSELDSQNTDKFKPESSLFDSEFANGPYKIKGAKTGKKKEGNPALENILAEISFNKTSGKEEAD